MINISNTILTSLSMSVDAMTVNATNGISKKDLKIRKMIFVSLMFGIFQFGMPVIGYFIGSTFKDKISLFIPMIGGYLLMFLGIKSLIDWKESRNVSEEGKSQKKLGFAEILLQSVATSIDALCIGFVYLQCPINEAMLIFSIIGITTFILSFIAVFFAKFLANKLEKWAGLIAAIVFFIIALKVAVF